MLSRPDFVKKQVLLIESDNSKKFRLKNSNLVLVNDKNRVVLQHPLNKIFIIFILIFYKLLNMNIFNVIKWK